LRLSSSFFFLSLPLPLHPHLPLLHPFPTRRSSDLSPRCRSECHGPNRLPSFASFPAPEPHPVPPVRLPYQPTLACVPLAVRPAPDRKSTRLNSSHVSISYAVFCLKKKNKLLYYVIQ